MSIWNWITQSWRRPAPNAARPDCAQTPVLDCEPFGIEPKPGTAAAALVNARHAAKTLRSTGTAVHNEP